jgi:hypothetical protein
MSTDPRWSRPTQRSRRKNAMNNADTFWLGCLAGMGFVRIVDWLFKIVNRTLDQKIAELEAEIEPQKGKENEENQ